MAELNISLHKAQATAFYSPKRFKVIVAGRRFGKTNLALATMVTWGLKNKTKKRDIFYIAPTYQQAKDIAWEELKALAAPVTATTHENTGVLTLINGVRIHLKGSDRPDTLRGVGLIGVVIDEYADMKPSVWEEIIRPALADVRGPALFIGTPKGRNHFYRLAEDAKEDESGEWGYFHFTTYDNPFIDPREIDAARKTLSSAAFRQEFLASFEAPASDLFKEEWFRFMPKPELPTTYGIATLDFLPCVTVDLAGFAEEAKQRMAKNKWLDESSLATQHGYRLPTDDESTPLRVWLEDTESGRWTVSSTAERIVKTAKRAGTSLVGIEKGIAFQAVLPVLPDWANKYGHPLRIHPLTHGNQNKTDRVLWALQGRLEHGYLTLNDTPGCRKFVEQCLQFPDPKSKDDVVDSVAYGPQLLDANAQTGGNIGIVDTFEPLDPYSGY